MGRRSAGMLNFGERGGNRGGEVAWLVLLGSSGWALEEEAV